MYKLNWLSVRFVIGRYGVRSLNTTTYNITIEGHYTLFISLTALYAVREIPRFTRHYRMKGSRAKRGHGLTLPPPLPTSWSVEEA